MSNQVILVLDRETAQEVLHEVPAPNNRCADCEVCTRREKGRAALRAALEVDPETRIEHIARAIAGCTFRPGTVEKAFTGDGLELVRDQAMNQAQAVLAALCENPGQERGLVDGASPTPVGHDEPGGENDG